MNFLLRSTIFNIVVPAIARTYKKYFVPRLSFVEIVKISGGKIVYRAEQKGQTFTMYDNKMDGPLIITLHDGETVVQSWTVENTNIMSHTIRNFE